MLNLRKSAVEGLRVKSSSTWPPPDRAGEHHRIPVWPEGIAGRLQRFGVSEAASGSAVRMYESHPICRCHTRNGRRMQTGSRENGGLTSGWAVPGTFGACASSKWSWNVTTNKNVSGQWRHCRGFDWLGVPCEWAPRDWPGKILPRQVRCPCPSRPHYQSVRLSRLHPTCSTSSIYPRVPPGQAPFRGCAVIGNLRCRYDLWLQTGQCANFPIWNIATGVGGHVVPHSGPRSQIWDPWPTETFAFLPFGGNSAMDVHGGVSVFEPHMQIIREIARSAIFFGCRVHT